VVGKESPGIAESRRFEGELSQAIQKTVSVLIILKDLSAFYPSDDQMLKHTRGIDAGLLWHKVTIPKGVKNVNLYFYGGLQIVSHLPCFRPPQSM
jgi:hypothetical protein